MMFRCPICKVKRSISVPPGVRKKNLRCHKCGETIKCQLNRREHPREHASGKLLMVTPDGKELEVFLTDKSVGGAGFDLSVAAIRKNKIAVGQEVRFKCNWSPTLIGGSAFTIVNIHGHRVGVKKVKKGLM